MVRIGRIFRDSQTRGRALENYENVTELPLLILALAIIPLLVVPLAWDLEPALYEAILATDWVIWAVFAMDLIVRTYLSEQRSRYLITHWYDVVIVAVPFLRPLRVLRSARALRLLRLSRAVAYGARFLTAARAIGQRHGLAYVMAAGLLLLLICASLVFAFERGNGGPIDDFGTAIWWSIVTVTTVGYGDAFPVTNEGRGIAVLLMVVGITLFGFLTANIAAFLVEQDRDTDATSLDDVMSKLESLERQVRDMRKEMVGDEPG